MFDSSTAYDFKSDLQSIKDKGRFRKLKEIITPQGPVIKIGDRELLNFCSNDYLGMANDARLVAAMHKAIDKYGIGSGASPLVCGRSDAHLILEQQISEYTGRERALVFTSGYLANLSVLTALGPGRKGEVFEDRLNHASLIDGAMMGRSKFTRFKHKNIASLSTSLNNCRGRKLVLTDAVFSMDGDIAPLQEIALVCKQHEAMFAVDDAHGFGVIGENGKGSLSLFGLNQTEVPILILTFGKAIGVSGGCVVGSSEIIEMLIQKARPYMYSTALPSALAATVSKSLKIIKLEEHRRAHLNNLIKRFKVGVKDLSLPVQDSDTPIQPLMIGDNDKAVMLSHRLFQQGFYIAAIRPPTVPANQARLRITLTAAHSETHVDRLLEALSSVMIGSEIR